MPNFWRLSSLLSSETKQFLFYFFFSKAYMYRRFTEKMKKILGWEVTDIIKTLFLRPIFVLFMKMTDLKVRLSINFWCNFFMRLFLTCLDTRTLQIQPLHWFKSYEIYPPLGSNDPFWPLNGVKLKKSPGCQIFRTKGVYKPIFKKIYFFVDPLQSCCIVNTFEIKR